MKKKNDQRMKAFERQLGQIANTVQRGSSSAFPSDTVNPREDCKAITLRSGKVTEEGPKVSPRVHKEKDTKQEDGLPKVTQVPKPVPTEVEPPYEKPTPYDPPFPYPQRLQKYKMEAQYKRFLEIFKKLEINIPLIEALEQMPKYVKFLKEALSRRRKYEDHETVALTS